jgi:carbon-monoxide dehydrogenase medium subunit
MWKRYENAVSLADVLALLDDHRERARIVAGGTDILIEMEQGQRPGVDTLIDITRVPGLDAIEERDGRITLGALVTHNHIMDSELLRARALPLVQACREVGAPQIRNRATIAGNIITASPANDTIVPLIALDASVTLASAEGERRVPLREFYTGLRQQVMLPNEMLTEISFPLPDNTARGVFLKLGLRRAQAISVVNAAVVLSCDDADRVTDAAIALGSVAPTIIRLPAVEALLQGEKLSDARISEAARLAATIPAPIDDVRSTAEYRSEMIKVLVARALRMLAAGTQDNLPDNPAMLWGTSGGRSEASLSQTTSHTPETPIEATVNGQPVSVNTGQEKTLLHWLRDDVGLPGTKEGCSEGECGACTVFLDGAAVMACMVPAPRAHDAEIVTVEGLKQNGELHPLQQAFVDNAAVQCGYCTPGFIMSGVKLLEEHPQPTRDQIQQSISGNLCRCTGYYKIIDAFIQASDES